MSWFTHTCYHCNEPIGKKSGERAWLSAKGYQCEVRVFKSGGMYGAHVPLFETPDIRK